MAKIMEWTAEQRQQWDAWVASRPPKIQEMCSLWPPDRLYLMKHTGQRCTIAAYAENGTVRVQITGQYNLHDFDKEVFGVDAQNLVECDLPAPGEALGVLLSDIETEEYIGARIAQLHRAGERHNEARCPLCARAAAVPS